ncbi:MAG TPA: phosphatase [Campylobacterales bacterium]|nr:phosphatase [Campylobacterales bacterium]
MVSIDLGSNTIRAIEIDCITLKKVAEYEKIVRTADNLHKTGTISDEAVDRIVNAIDEIGKILNLESGVKAVTTEAVRRAKNGLEVIDFIKKSTGVEFQIIDGKQEAYYTLLAVVNRLEKLNFKVKKFILVDIGGGSTELIFFNDNKINVKSFPIGVVTTAQKYRTKDKIIENLPSEMDEIKDFIDEYYKVAEKPDMFVSTAGTPTTVAAMKLGMNYKTYDADRINGVYLQKDDLEEQMERLLSLDEKSRQELVGVGREDLIVAGILIFRHLYDLLGFDRAYVIDDGLREGVAIAKCKKLKIDEIFH